MRRVRWDREPSPVPFLILYWEADQNNLENTGDTDSNHAVLPANHVFPDQLVKKEPADREDRNKKMAVVYHSEEVVLYCAFGAKQRQ